MIKYPISFCGEAQATMGLDTNWESKASEFTTTCAIPKEFEGQGNGLSPEDLYLMALQNCFLATFKVYAHYSRCEFESVKVATELTVDLNTDKKPCMKRVLFKISISGAKDKNRIETLIKKAIASGFVLNSIKTEIESDIHFQS